MNKIVRFFIVALFLFLAKEVHSLHLSSALFSIILFVLAFLTMLGIGWIRPVKESWTRMRKSPWIKRICIFQFMTCAKGIAENPVGFSVWTTAYGRGVMLNVAASQQLFLLLPPLRGLLKATRYARGCLLSCRAACWPVVPPDFHYQRKNALKKAMRN